MGQLEVGVESTEEELLGHTWEAKGKARRKKCKVRFSIIKNNKAFKKKTT